MKARSSTTWVDALARLRPRDRAVPDPSPVLAPPPSLPPGAVPVRLVVDPQRACAITGAKRAKKKCCRSTPRCKGCPVVLMRAARAAESGLTGKDLAKAVKRARAA
ncbi:hypothetical protein [Actinomycetospora atypica]|uniref:Uncharacterized protein n=1 Tax=Actinomycetospora atypica TaxID=1290095 RepID=A0ABV9YNL3_9PSEU